jgi:hypothetical protein
MKVFSMLTGFALISISSAWDLTFWDENYHKHAASSHHIHASGTKDVSCNNVRSDGPRFGTIVFDENTSFYPDPSVYTVYSGADCTGKSYTGAPGAVDLDSPMVIKSYKLH